MRRSCQVGSSRREIVGFVNGFPFDCFMANLIAASTFGKLTARNLTLTPDLVFVSIAPDM